MKGHKPNNNHTTTSQRLHSQRSQTQACEGWERNSRSFKPNLDEKL